MFVDKVIISLKGGDGGSGCCSFRREKFIPKGGPDGGDGGPGGNVVLETTTGEQSLAPFVFNRHYMANSGPHGKGKTLHGRKADDIVLKIPIGTVVSDADTGEFIIDMDHEGMRHVIAKGGKGGKGNARFMTSQNRAPREHESGFPGEERKVIMELKTIADIGLVGYPNAGKSTLLGAVSHAKPKVAPYPFTPLHPFVGVIEFPDYCRLTMAAIPGLVDGAHDNVGLGHSFLKHIERTKILAYVLDMGGVDCRNPWEDFEHLRNELELYMKGLSKRPSIIIANKMDLPNSAENLELLKQSELVNGLEIIPISAATDADFSALVNRLRLLVEQEKGKQVYY